MGYFPVSYDSRVIIYERKMFIRLATGKFSELPIRWEWIVSTEINGSSVIVTGLEQTDSSPYWGN